MFKEMFDVSVLQHSLKFIFYCYYFYLDMFYGAPIIMFFPSQLLLLIVLYSVRRMQCVYQVWTLTPHSSTFIIHLPFIYSVILKFSSLEHSAINPHPSFLARNNSISPHATNSIKKKRHHNTVSVSYSLSYLKPWRVLWLSFCKNH